MEKRAYLGNANIILTGAGISILIMGISNDILILKIIAFFIFSIFAAFSVKFDILHPYMWFIPCFVMYSIASPLLLELGTHPYNSFGGHPIRVFDHGKVLNLHFIAMIAASFFITPAVNKPYHDLTSERFAILKKGVSWIFIISLLLCISHVVGNKMMGFTGKGDMVLSRNPLSKFSFAFNIVNVCASIYLLEYLVKKETSKMVRFVTFASVLLFISFLLSGHRNIMYRFFVMFIMLYCSYKKISLKKLLIIFSLFVVGMFAATQLENLKMALLREYVPMRRYINIESQLGLATLSPYKVWILQTLTSILGTELMTSSNVLAIIVYNVPRNLPFLYGSGFLYDIVRAVAPGFLFYWEAVSTASHYHKLLFPNLYYAGHGPGFSLVAAGYANFGLIGVTGLFSFYGYILKRLYAWYSKSLIGFIFYINFIAIGIIAIRTDLSAPISQSWKHILLPLGVMLLIGTMTRRVRYSGAGKQFSAIPKMNMT